MCYYCCYCCCCCVVVVVVVIVVVVVVVVGVGVVVVVVVVGGGGVGVGVVLVVAIYGHCLPACLLLISSQQPSTLPTDSSACTYLFTYVSSYQKRLNAICCHTCILYVHHSRT